MLLTTFYSGDQIEKKYLAVTCGSWGERGGAYRVSMGKPQGKRSLGKPRRKLEDNIKMYLQKIRWFGMDDLARNKGKRGLF